MLTADPLLNVQDVSVHFGGIVALDGVSFDIPRGQIVGLIGPNGAGKTTLFNCISRLYNVNKGDILFNGKSILKSPVYKMSSLGVGRTFQNLALFANLTVLDNVMIGGHSTCKADYLSNALHLPWIKREEKELRARSMDVLRFMGLEQTALQRIGDLPFGVQKRLEIARALLSKPKLLLMDEPAGGLNHNELSELVATIRRIRDEFGTTVLLVEHHMGLVMEVSEKVVALSFGRKLAEGSPKTIQEHPDVIEAYLGTGKK
ncbi:ABC transporter ATP-binding protein [Sneathiella sp.]|uniref:ABC transporter ATP-binding protein n=1 Tax=Sneathiella sp. TaxID=1964365 RepID=UPI003561A7D3